MVAKSKWRLKVTDEELGKYRSELMASYPDCHVKVAEDKKEMVAEISEDFAIAVIERSIAHFHLKTVEVYGVLRGTLHVACGGRGHVLHQGDRLTVEPGQVHFARASGEPAWIEVKSAPPWSADDHFVL